MNRRFSSYKTASGDSSAVVKLDKSGGCVDREDSYLQEVREAVIKEYFFGDAKSTLSPHTQQISFDDATIYKIGDG
jgi:polyribonucleotide 5'-hydroxyl-kinase